MAGRGGSPAAQRGKQRRAAGAENVEEEEEEENEEQEDVTVQSTSLDLVLPEAVLASDSGEDDEHVTVCPRACLTGLNEHARRKAMANRAPYLCFFIQ